MKKQKEFLTKQMNKTKKFIEKLELDLLSSLFDYVVPFIKNKIKKPQQGPSNLETIVNNPKPKIDFKDIKELESLLLKNLNENIKANKSIEINSNNVFYRLNLTRKKNEKYQ